MLSCLQEFNLKRVSASAIPESITSMTWTAPKMAEATRQIERLTIARQYAENRDNALDDVEGITSCMSLLGHFAVGPIPVPVASWTAGEGPSLFITTDNFYGDLEVEGNQIEYFLRWDQAGQPVEIFDTETVNEGRVPPRLLAHLFSVFAKRNAAVL